MVQLSVKQFFELVQQSKLVEEAKLAKAMTDYKQEHQGKLPQTANELADWFIHLDLLTQWHCDKLLQGKYKGFFLGRYKLLGHLGAGGMSSVYLAEHDVMRQKRAIKVLPRKLVKDASYRDRFLLEAQATAALDHPNLVRAYDFDMKGDEGEEPTYYLVMDYINGKDLQTLVKENGPLDFKVAAGYVAQAATGLGYVHQQGLIHRDVKPANLLIDDKNSVKILDLGLALFSDDDQIASVTLTHNENILGTADYLAPEQAVNSHNVDSRVDIYGLGCTLYYILTGRALFPEGSLAQRIAKHQKEMPDDIRVSRQNCPKELIAICNKMIQKNPDHRYQTCLEINQVLEDWVQDKPVSVPLALVGSLAAEKVSDGSDGQMTIGDTSTINLDRSKELTAEDEERLAEIDSQASRGTVKDPRLSATAVGRDGSKSGSVVTGDSGPPPVPGSHKDLEVPSSRIDLGIEVLGAGSHKETRSQRLLDDRRRSRSGLWWIIGGVAAALILTVLVVSLLVWLLGGADEDPKEDSSKTPAVRDTSAIELIDDDVDQYWPAFL